LSREELGDDVSIESITAFITSTERVLGKRKAFDPTDKY
jgi:hypothetical protein